MEHFFHNRTIQEAGVSFGLGPRHMWSKSRLSTNLSTPLTLVLKSVGRVFAPVRRFTRKTIQFEYLCWMPEKHTTATMTLNVRDSAEAPSAPRLTFWRYEGFSVGSTPTHRVNLWDAEVTPEVFTRVVVEALITQEGLEPCRQNQLV